MFYIFRAIGNDNLNKFDYCYDNIFIIFNIIHCKIFKLSTMRKDGVVSANWRTVFKIISPRMTHVFKIGPSCEEGSALPDCISLVRIIGDFYFDHRWLYYRMSTYVLVAYLYLFNLSLTLFYTPFCNLYLKPAKSVEPPLSTMLEYNFLLESMGQSWTTLSMS
jgi:hypothetical protein